MTSLERLIARIMQIVKASPGTIITITAVVDAEGRPICWQVTNAKAEGLDKKDDCVSEFVV